MNTTTNNYSVDIAFYNYYVTMQREPMISSVVKNDWNWNFANFRDLVLILPEAATGGVLLLSCNFIKKETMAQEFSCNFC